MLPLVYTSFSLGIVLVIVASLATLALPWRARGLDWLGVPRAAASIGALFLFGMLALRAFQYQLVPLTSGVESLSLLVVMITWTVFAITQDAPRRNLTLVYLPAIAGIAIIAALLAPAELPRPPKPLSPLLLLLHVVPAFLAYAWFFIAMLTSAVYLYQASRLKRRLSLGPIQQLPSLENMDRTLFLLISMAYPLFVVTLVTGAYWAWADRELLGALWWMSPKIMLSLAMVVIYATCYHGRATGLLRGPRLANVLLIGVGSLLAAYLLLEIFGLTNYNFWGATE
ncbi:MAG: hypothetical protein RLZZ303_2022 [Candidatus Hydrogenedentota bacterium]|jgi:ABC-type uncharacterized transport system permease subunit